MSTEQERQAWRRPWREVAESFGSWPVVPAASFAELLADYEAAERERDEAKAEVARQVVRAEFAELANAAATARAEAAEGKLARVRETLVAIRQAAAVMTVGRYGEQADAMLAAVTTMEDALSDPTPEVDPTPASDPAGDTRGSQAPSGSRSASSRLPWTAPRDGGYHGKPTGAERIAPSGPAAVSGPEGREGA